MHIKNVPEVPYSLWDLAREQKLTSYTPPADYHFHFDQTCVLWLLLAARKAGHLGFFFFQSCDKQAKRVKYEHLASGNDLFITIWISYKETYYEALAHIIIMEAENCITVTEYLPVVSWTLRKLMVQFKTLKAGQSMGQIQVHV